MAKATLQKKCDDRISVLIRVAVGCCEICLKLGRPKKDGLEIKGLEIHHLISRSVQQVRYHPYNLIVLDLSHHGAYPSRQNRRRNAHSQDTAIKQRFEDWLERQILPTGENLLAWRDRNLKLRLPMKWNHRDMYDLLMSISIGSTLTEISDAIFGLIGKDEFYLSEEMNYENRANRSNTQENKL